MQSLNGLPFDCLNVPLPSGTYDAKEFPLDVDVELRRVVNQDLLVGLGVGVIQEFVVFENLGSGNPI